MKMQFGIFLKKNNHFVLVEGKTESEAFDNACEEYGINGFSGFKRHFPDENKLKHEDFFLKKAISNPVKHKFKESRHGFKH